MIVSINGQNLTYKASTGDWVIYVVAEENSITITLNSNMDSFSFSSGVNFDNLATFINAVKSDCEARGINWSGQ